MLKGAVWQGLVKAGRLYAYFVDELAILVRAPYCGNDAPTKSSRRLSAGDTPITAYIPVDIIGLCIHIPGGCTCGIRKCDEPPLLLSLFVSAAKPYLQTINGRVQQVLLDAKQSIGLLNLFQELRVRGREKVRRILRTQYMQGIEVSPYTMNMSFFNPIVYPEGGYSGIAAFMYNLFGQFYTLFLYSKKATII